MKYFFIVVLLIFVSACSLLRPTNELGIDTKKSREKTILIDVGDKYKTLFDKGVYPNSFESLTLAFNSADGAQIDLQLSKDSTLWLFGEEKIRDCVYQNFKSISEYNFEDINFASICWYEKQLIPL